MLQKVMLNMPHFFDFSLMPYIYLTKTCLIQKLAILCNACVVLQDSNKIYLCLEVHAMEFTNGNINKANFLVEENQCKKMRTSQSQMD